MGADEALQEATKWVVREERDRSGMSMRELAAAAGLDHSLIYRIEQGGVRTYLDVLPRLAQGFGIGPVEFFALIYARARYLE